MLMVVVVVVGGERVVVWLDVGCWMGIIIAF
jgi:hypothetical protein